MQTSGWRRKLRKKGLEDLPNGEEVGRDMDLGTEKGQAVAWRSEKKSSGVEKMRESRRWESRKGIEE